MNPPLPEDYLSPLLQVLPAGVMVHAPDTRILLANAEAARMTNLGPDQLVGQLLADVAWPFVRLDGTPLPLNDHPVSRVLATRAAVHEVTLGVPRAAPDDKTWVLVSAFPAFDEQQALTQIAVTFLDITERKRAEEALQTNTERLRLTLEAANAGMWEWNVHTNENSWSDELWGLYGLAPYSCAPSYEAWRQTIHPADRAHAEHAVQEAARTGSDLHTEWRVFTPDGSERWLLSRGRAARDAQGRIVRFLGIVLDITARRTMEHALQQSATNFAKAFRSSPAALLLTRLADGRFLEVNDAYCATVGYAREELLGRLTTEFRIYLHDHDRQVIVAQLLNIGSVRNFETRIRHRSGEVRHVIAAQELITFNDEPCILSHLLDITEHKRLEGELHTASQHLHAILTSLYGGILVLRGDHRVEFANQAFCDLFSLTERPDALLGLLASEIIERIAGVYADPPTALARIRAIVGSAQPVRNEEVAIRGGRTYLRDFVPIVVDGQPYGRVWHHVDITALKQAEVALEAERALLAQRVAERTADLSWANAELVRAARVKDEFLSSMSHELRTPLNAILGRAELLHEQIYGPLSPKQDVAVQSIGEAGQHLLGLINDILDLAKVEGGKLNLDLAPLKVEAIGEAAVRMVAQQAMSKQINLSVSYDSRIETLIADERRLKQILLNLLSNAVKFTPAGGNVGLEVHADPGQRVVTFTIWDTGIGITPEDQARLFQPFVQLDNRLSREHDGTGLGLALVLRLTELHGGSIALESTPGQGSRFSVSLPWVVQAAPAAGGAAPCPEPPPAPSAIHQALVFEDVHSAVEQLRRELVELGSRVEVHDRASGVVERAGALQPDLIVLDILLPDQSGWEVLRQLKVGPRTAAIPVLVVSAVDEPARALALGAAGFVLKPHTREHFLQTLRQLPARAEAAASPMIPLTLIVAPQQSSARPLVLLVDDNEANLALMADYLPTVGYRVAVARNGAEAVARAEELNPAVIVMDIQMPVLDGLEATRRIRAAGLRDTPILALTALAMAGDRERCLAAGADAYLSKPVGLGTLMRAIAEVLASAQVRGAGE